MARSKTADVTGDVREEGLRGRRSISVDQDTSTAQNSNSATTQLMKRRRHIATTDESGQEETRTSARRPRRRKRLMSPYQEKQSTNNESSEHEALKSDGNQKFTASRTADIAKVGSIGNAETEEVMEKEKQSEEGSAKILLELDLEAEVALDAKVKGDVTLGLTE